MKDDDLLSKTISTAIYDAMYQNDNAVSLLRKA